MRNQVTDALRRTAAALALAAAASLAPQTFAAPDRLPTITYPFDDQGEFWVNSEPLADSDLRGKAVLVMFWTYGCVNCRNSIEWVKHVHDSYADRGLLVLGVHTPEFDYEKDKDSVRRKTGEYGLEFPVMIDNDFTYWKDMGNSWWPAFYLADAHGNIKASFIGETHLGTGKSERILGLIEAELPR